MTTTQFRATLCACVVLHGRPLSGSVSIDEGGCMTSKRGPKAEEKISSTMDKNLRVYALAAFAAGVGITALSTTAEAGVVYTPTYRQITDVTGSLPIDFNHDGVQDVHLSAKF